MLRMTQAQVDAIKAFRLTKAEWQKLPLYQTTVPGMHENWCRPGQPIHPLAEAGRYQATVARNGTPERFPVRLWRFADRSAWHVAYRKQDGSAYKIEDAPWNLDATAWVGCFIPCAEYPKEVYVVMRRVELLD